MKKVIIWIITLYNILMYFSPIILPETKYNVIIFAIYLGILFLAIDKEYKLYIKKRGKVSRIEYLNNRTKFLSENFSYIIISIISAVLFTVLFLIRKYIGL